MSNKDDRGVNATIILLAAFFLAVSIACIFLFFNCVERYSQFDVEYSDLKHERLTFVQYEKIKMGKGGYAYKIFFQEYEEPFLIDNITIKRVDRWALESLPKNRVVEVYFEESSNRNYKYEICEMSSQTIIPLSLDGYIGANQDNQILGMIFLPIMTVLSLFFVWFFAHTLIPQKVNNGFGRVRIEYEINGNKIRIYHSIQGCTLVINDKIFDQHYGEYASHNVMKGMLKTDGKVVCVEAKMRAAYMCLYCNGKRVAKKFMLFG